MSDILTSTCLIIINYTLIIQFATLFQSIKRDLKANIYSILGIVDNCKYMAQPIVQGMKYNFTNIFISNFYVGSVSKKLS